jgi:hypothetical protein
MRNLMRIVKPIRQAVLLVAALLTLVALQPAPSYARELDFQASIVEHQPTYLLVHTSGNENLRFELGWFKNTDGYALNRDEFYCFEVEQTADGKLMLISVQTCEERARRRGGNEDSGGGQQSSPS